MNVPVILRELFRILQNCYEEIIAKKYALAAGQYFDVKIEYVDMTPEEFNEKMAGYQAELVKLFDEGDKLQKEIIEQLNLCVITAIV